LLFSGLGPGLEAGAHPPRTALGPRDPLERANVIAKTAKVKDFLSSQLKRFSRVSHGTPARVRQSNPQASNLANAENPPTFLISCFERRLTKTIP
jgi:hypothetical protein